jgi:hypothetical protein
MDPTVTSQAPDDLDRNVMGSVPFRVGPNYPEPAGPGTGFEGKANRLRSIREKIRGFQRFIDPYHLDDLRAIQGRSFADIQRFH